MENLNQNNTYEYPGFEDTVFNNTIQGREPYPGYWYQSEEYAFSFVDSLLKGTKRERFLDLGCGEGRLTKRFSKYFTFVVAIDPDPARVKRAEMLNQAKNAAHKKFYSGKVNNMEFPANYFDVILISHVIQHIHTSDVDNLIQTAYNILKPNGILVVTTSHAWGDNDLFLNTKVHQGTFSTNTITEGIFNDYITNDQSILPVHMFSIKNLKKRFSKFKISRIKVFHILDFPETLEKIMFRDKMVNRFFSKKSFGMDVMFVLRK